jgi:hypothetical protein
MKKPSSSFRAWLLVVVFLILAGTAAYFIGTAVGSNAREKSAAAEKAKLQNARGQILRLQSVNELLHANVWAYRAVYALDDRNFGVANDDATKVVASLRAINATSAGVGANAVSALQREAAGVKISVAQNLESQRAQLLHLAAGITRLAEQSEAKARSTR